MTRHHVLLGLCGLFGVVTCALVSPVSARSSDGFGAFRAVSSSQSCVGETFGGALNNCSSAIGPVIFELITDNAGTNNISAISFGSGNGPIGGCYGVSLNPANSTTFNKGTVSTFNPTGQQTLAFPVTVNNGWSLRLQCDSMAVHRGIGGMTW